MEVPILIQRKRNEIIGLGLDQFLDLAVVADGDERLEKEFQAEFGRKDHPRPRGEIERLAVQFSIHEVDAIPVLDRVHPLRVGDPAAVPGSH